MAPPQPLALGWHNAYTLGRILCPLACLCCTRGGSSFRKHLPEGVPGARGVHDPQELAGAPPGLVPAQHQDPHGPSSSSSTRQGPILSGPGDPCSLILAAHAYPVAAPHDRRLTLPAGAAATRVLSQAPDLSASVNAHCLPSGFCLFLQLPIDVANNHDRRRQLKESGLGKVGLPSGG